MKETTLMAGLLTMVVLALLPAEGHRYNDYPDCYYYDRYDRNCNYYPPTRYHYHDHHYHTHPIPYKYPGYSHTCRYLAAHPHLLRRIRKMLVYYFSNCYDPYYEYSNFHY
ncbi:hypothetical protein C7M84_016512 [Penaeus vannamei]|uniref:Uncharacterized protein n=1 Tax=Penaeus vannamei TaxID=6689 RepID=A0A3R7M2K1_PENVA|nr:uncharacterized protein LOC113820055 [Penaeus vannamei]ROT65527.1 hypothetical protein C7M84_016512 [Penaeus vannamei]